MTQNRCHMRGGVKPDMNRTKIVTLDNYWCRNAFIEAKHRYSYSSSHKGKHKKTKNILPVQ